MTPMGIAHEDTMAAPSRPANAGDRLDEGAEVGDYVVDRFLGAGAMGEVYAGRHPVIGKKVAIKVLKRELASDAEAAERFVREARAVNQIDHDNVIDVFNFGQLDDGRLYLVMDLVDGRSLRTALGDGPLPVATALAILDKVAEALDAAHARGVVHRDLKPDNVMLAGDPESPRVFVLDFGIAKLVAGNPGGNATLTAKGTWLGTPGYMAPEQWSADGAGPASDRYALGVMAYELLSGALPFEASTLPQMMEQHFRAPVPALSSRGKTPPELGDTINQIDPVLARAMAKSPDERFATARELVAALRRAVAGEGGLHPVVARSSRTLVAPAAAGIGVLGLAIAGFVIVRHGERDDPQRPDPATHEARSPTDLASIMVDSVPSKAAVRRDGQLLGLTPVKLDASPSDTLDLAISRAGYRSVKRHVTVAPDLVVRVDLQPITGFEGMWALPDGRLRELHRTADDHVEIARLRTASGAPEPWRTAELVDNADGIDPDIVTFATSATMADERAPDGDTACDHIAHRVEYRYDPRDETLVVRAEIVGTKIQNGRCIEESRKPGEPIAMTRVDRDRGDTHYTQPPVGIPIAKQKRRAAKPTPKSVTSKLSKLPVKKVTSNPKSNAVDPPRQAPQPPPANNRIPNQAASNPPVPQAVKRPPTKARQQAKPNAPNAPNTPQAQVPRGDAQTSGNQLGNQQGL